MIGNQGTYGSAWDNFTTGLTYLVGGSQAATAKIAAEQRQAATSRASDTGGSPAPSAGDYAFPDGYVYRLDNSGRVYIVKSPRTRLSSPQEVSAATTAGQAILREVAAHPDYKVADVVPALPSYGPVTPTGGSTWTLPPQKSGVVSTSDKSVDRPQRGETTALLLLAGLGAAIGVGLLTLTRR